MFVTTFAKFLAHATRVSSPKLPWKRCEDHLQIAEALVKPRSHVGLCWYPWDPWPVPTPRWYQWGLAPAACTTPYRGGGTREDVGRTQGIKRGRRPKHSDETNWRNKSLLASLPSIEYYIYGWVFAIVLNNMVNYKLRYYMNFYE